MAKIDLVKMQEGSFQKSISQRKATAVRSGKNTRLRVRKLGLGMVSRDLGSDQVSEAGPGVLGGVLGAAGVGGCAYPAGFALWIR